MREPERRALEEVMATMSGESADPFKTMGMGAGAAATLRVEDFQATFKDAQDRCSVATDSRGSKTPTTHLARLRHLCRLIIRDRRGFCPINGVLLTLPIGIDTRTDLADLADACRKDLATMFDTFRMRCPVLAMVCGLEQVNGFSELIERLPAEQRRKRMGQRFPLVPDLTAGEVPEKIAGRRRGGHRQPVSLDGPYDVPGGVSRVRGRRRGASRQHPALPVPARYRGAGRADGPPRQGLHPEPSGRAGHVRRLLLRRHGSRLRDRASLRLRRPDADVKEDQDSVTWTEEALDQDATAARLVGRVRLAFLVIITLGILAAAGIIAQRILATPVDSNAASSKGS